MSYTLSENLSRAQVSPAGLAQAGPESETQLSVVLPLLRLRPAAARDLWHTLIDPGPGMRLDSAWITVAMDAGVLRFEDIEPLLACDQLPDAVFRLTMYSTFLPEAVDYGMGDLARVTFSAKPVVFISGRSEIWAGGKLYALQNAGRRMRSPYWWLRPWNSVNLLVGAPLLAMLALVYVTLLLWQRAFLLTILPVMVVLLLMCVVGLVDERAFRLTQSRITRSPMGAWTRTEKFGAGSMAVSVVSVVVAVAIWLSTKP